MTGLQRCSGTGIWPKSIESFWLAPEHRGETWMAHQDINMVMLATSLAPGGYLALQFDPA